MRLYLKDGDFRHSKSNVFRGAIIVKIFALDHGDGLFDMPQHLQNCFIQRPTSNFTIVRSHISLCKGFSLVKIPLDFSFFICIGWLHEKLSTNKKTTELFNKSLISIFLVLKLLVEVLECMHNLSFPLNILICSAATLCFSSLLKL